MTNILKIGAGVIAGIVVGLLLAMTFGVTPTLAGVYNQVNNKFFDGLMAGKTDQFQVTNKGVIISNGVDSLTVQYSFISTSSVPVSIPNPFGVNGLAPDAAGAATTTVTMAVCQTTSTGIAGVNKFSLATSSTAYATSSPAFVYEHTIASGAQDTMVWMPTRLASTSVAVPNSLFRAEDTGDGRSPFILGPSEYLNWRIATGTPGSFSTGYYRGTCSATFLKP